MEFVAIEKVDLVNSVFANNPLLTREAYWMAQLCTIGPYGLNKRSELRSKKLDSLQVVIIIIIIFCKLDYVILILLLIPINLSVTLYGNIDPVDAIKTGYC